MASEILFVRSLEKNVYIVDITMERLEDGDYKTNISNFGEEAIEIGKEVTDASDQVLATIPSRKIKISQLPQNPISQKFAEAVYGTLAKDIAIAWCEQTKQRITDYISSKIAKFDDFSGEETINI